MKLFFLFLYKSTKGQQQKLLNVGKHELTNSIIIELRMKIITAPDAVYFVCQYSYLFTQVKFYP